MKVQISIQLKEKQDSGLLVKIVGEIPQHKCSKYSQASEVPATSDNN